MERQPVVAMADYTANATYVKRASDLSDRYVVAATIQVPGATSADIIRGSSRR